MLLEKPLMSPFYAKNQQSRPKAFQPANGSFLEFTKKLFPATQNGSSGNLFSSQNASSTISSYLLSCFSAIFSFLLTISRPPRGYVKTKKVLHTLSNPPHNPVRRSPDPRSTMPGHNNPIP